MFNWAVEWGEGGGFCLLGMYGTKMELKKDLDVVEGRRAREICIGVIGKVGCYKAPKVGAIGT